MTFPYALLIGFVLDLLLGDPLWLPHPVVAIGTLISAVEKGLRGLLPKTRAGELAGGGILVALVALTSFAVPWVLLWLLGLWHPAARLVGESLLCYQILAMRCLRDESEGVRKQVETGDLTAARKQVARIVGRDTEQLSMEGVIKATVETVAENTSDGVIAPMLFLFLGGAPLGMFYKAVNTMDSMIGYKNDRYLYFGRIAARLDDLANLVPARITGLLMVAAAFLCGLDGKGAWRIFRRDRNAHASPNAGQAEAACAGALGIQLLGDASYFGKKVSKPTVGDADRPPQAEDIRRTNRLLYASSTLFLFTGVGISLLMGVFLWS